MRLFFPEIYDLRLLFSELVKNLKLKRFPVSLYVRIRIHIAMLFNKHEKYAVHACDRSIELL